MCSVVYIYGAFGPVQSRKDNNKLRNDDALLFVLRALIPIVLSWASERMAGGGEKVQLGPTRRFEELQSFHFDVPWLAREIWARFPAMAYPLPPRHSARHSLNLRFLQIPMGSIRCRKRFLRSLYLKLTQEPLDEDSIARVCEATELAYDRTPDSNTNGTSESPRVLRRMLSAFIATYRDKFVKSRTFTELHGQEG